MTATLTHSVTKMQFHVSFGFSSSELFKLLIFFYHFSRPNFSHTAPMYPFELFLVYTHHNTLQFMHILAYFGITFISYHFLFLIFSIIRLLDNY